MTTSRKPHGEVVAERRARLKAAGLCIRCGQRPAVPGPRGGTRVCGPCRVAEHAVHDRWLARSGYKETPQYKARAAARKRELEARLLAEGICVTRCGRPATVGKQGSARYCDECRAKYRERQRRRSAELHNRQFPNHRIANRAQLA